LRPSTQVVVNGVVSVVAAIVKSATDFAGYCK
jgi:hypothetical protein